MVGAHLNVQLYVTAFDFISGKLDLSMKSYPIGNENTEHSQPPRFVNLFILYVCISSINIIIFPDWK